jgi:SAM-dependent methyltransferase
MKRFAPATQRNREPIRDVLARELPASGTVLELASGSGEHAIFMAAAFPHLTWQPTDLDPDALASIAAWRAEAALPNLREPLRLDACDATWPVSEASAITCCNMIHISPWEATLGMFAGAARLLAPGALLYLYGPYRFNGAFTAPSNEAFDASLRSRDPSWGVRDVTDLEAAASGFALREVISMPANNHSLVFRRV